MDPSNVMAVTPRPSAVLLAAGSASRMGYRPKCLLERDGTALLVRLIGQLHAAGVSDLVLVLGHHAGPIGAAVDAMAPLPGLSLRRVVNADPGSAQDASLRLGLSALPADATVVLVQLADQPLLEAADVQQLLDLWRQRPPGIECLQPMHQGQPGHPVLLSAVAAEALRSAPPGQGGRQWQAAHPQAVWRWAASHARYSTDVDQPQDIERLRAAGVALDWPAD